MELLETKERFIELRAKGWSFDKIAKELGKAKQTLIDWSKDLDKEIANLKALELEALYEKHYLLKEAKIEKYGAILSKLKTEIDSRDLSDLPTDKLLDLLLKYETFINAEVIEPNIKSSKEIKEEREDKGLLEELTTLKVENSARLKVG